MDDKFHKISEGRFPYWERVMYPSQDLPIPPSINLRASLLALHNYHTKHTIGQLVRFYYTFSTTVLIKSVGLIFLPVESLKNSLTVMKVY